MNASIEKEESSHSASKLVQTCFNVSSDKWRAIIKLHCMQSFWSFKQDSPPQTRVKLITIKVFGATIQLDCVPSANSWWQQLQPDGIIVYSFVQSDLKGGHFYSLLTNKYPMYVVSYIH